MTMNPGTTPMDLLPVTIYRAVEVFQVLERPVTLMTPLVMIPAVMIRSHPKTYKSPYAK